MDSSAEVLIAGAGPVGLTAALDLTRRGIGVRIVDAAPGPATTSRAIATHPRTLEVYAQLGVIDAVLSRGRRITGFALYRDGRRLARLAADYTDMPTRYPFTLCIDQIVTEEILRDALRAHGVEPEWGVRLESFEQDDEGVTAELRRGESTETYRVPWLIGCDGGHSTVRKVLDLPLIGASRQTWLLADAQVETDLPPNSIYWIRANAVTMMAVPFIESGRWRVLDTVDVDYDGDPVRLAERLTGKLRTGLGGHVLVHPPTWVSVFTAQQRMVPRMRQGRCFVAGDAAHVHSPASGQGMNTGIQESYNLGWKLAMVVRGHAGQSLLDTYGLERVPVGEGLLSSTEKATSLVQLSNPVADRLLPLVFGAVSRIPALRRRMQGKMLGAVSGLNLEYAQSPLTRANGGASAPRPGQRLTRRAAGPEGSPAEQAFDAELQDLRWTLLVAVPARAGGELAELLDVATTRHDAWLSVRSVGAGDGSGAPGLLRDRDGALRASLGLAEGGWILVRPDGYVSARGRRLDQEVVDALAAQLWPDRTVERA
ncbi:FAD-dependent monooxygenase [Nonomuraea sp. NPDC050556]|uniref:FAD-dependent monooxygenase n=1 Tax=Nonomuraea sp. NPDC050556 TaxID=3364369 RepID=UPI0037A58C88